MTKQLWRKAIGLTMAAVLFVPALVFGVFSSATAHISNETTLFPDIVAGTHTGDIMMLVALDVIPQTQVFEPDAPLELKDLAAWASMSHRLSEGGESPDVNTAAQLGLDAGLVPSLDGEATNADINVALFDGQLNLDVAKVTVTPTKAEAAAFIVNHLETDLGGETLLSRLGAVSGPTGTVANVSQEGEGHHATYTFTIDGTSLPVSAHGLVAFGPTDLTQWEGRDVTRSVAITDDNQKVLSFVQARQLPGGSSSLEPDHHSGHEHGTSMSHNHDEPLQIPVQSGVAVPTVKVIAEPDAMSGWNIHVMTTHFTWTPENVNGLAYLNEGHAHLYVDGEKVTRLYGPWYLLSNDLSPGNHTVKVTLNANNHAPFAYKGEEIADTVTVTVEE